ncbi:MAG: polysulfide reductase NrfD [Chloroflexota bacterium]|nr:polysulfide reductase NrfD [Chloroflexota bacterium]
MAYQRRWQSPKRGGRSASDESAESYYGVAPIHKPHWKWLIIAYFYLGGISGLSYVIAEIARRAGGAQNRAITRAGRYISFGTLLPCPVLLILDLGRPERFLNMLRVFKLRSPMSVGTWVLVAFSGFCTISAVVQATQDGLLNRFGAAHLLATRGQLARWIGALGVPMGFLLGGYTGVLLAATAVPLWTRNALLMGPLFLASSASNATAAITLSLSLGKAPHRTIARLERLEVCSLVAELGLLTVNRKRLGAAIGRPLRAGRTGRLYRYGVHGLGIIAPMVLTAVPMVTGMRPSHRRTALSSLLALGGGVIFRYVMVVAGHHSADDPQATFELTRRGREKSVEHSTTDAVRPAPPV